MCLGVRAACTGVGGLGVGGYGQLWAGVGGCEWVWTGVRMYVWDEFSEFLPENIVPTSADFNTYPIRIFHLNLKKLHSKLSLETFKS